ncbi:DUF721 domain-containing protein [bacterium]|nr:MAG: DUF721 domain-containing protein [bacterium]
MFEKLSQTLSGKYKKKDELGRHLEIVKIIDIYLANLKKIFPSEKTTRPVSVKKKVLTVETTSSVLAGELRLRETEFLEAINQGLGSGVVTRIIYRF